MAPCCWSQQVSIHQSEAAAEIKRDIRDRLRSGLTSEQILDAYVARYGTRILVEPPARGFAAWLYVLPVLALVVSAGGLAFVVRRFATRGASAQAQIKNDVSPAEQDDMKDRLDDELRDLD